MKHPLTIFSFMIFFILMIFTRLFSQTIWSKYPDNPILEPGEAGSWDESGITDPKVVFDGESYHLWYSGSLLGTTQVGYATSPDGFTWTKSENNPVIEPGSAGSWDSVSVLAGAVIVEEELFKMWYWGFDGTMYQVGYATSSDGVNWSKYEGNPVLTTGDPGSWEGEAVWAPSVIHQGDIYQMWYVGHNKNFEERKIGYATSDDGIHWSRYEGNPVVDIGDEGDWDMNFVDCAAVIYKDNRYQMWFVGYNGISNNVGYATSSDGVNWEKYEHNPVLKTGRSGAWDSWGLWCSAVIYRDGKYMMWYDGYLRGHLFRIGCATAPTTIHVPEEKPTIQAGINAARDGDCVLVTDGTYEENIDFKGKAITVASHFIMDDDTNHISNTIIDGSQFSNKDSASVVYFGSGEDTTSVLCGFTITGGSGTLRYWEADDFFYREGGGIDLYYSGGKVIHNKISDNHIITGANEHGYGAGMSSRGMKSVNLIVRDNDISNNTVNTYSGAGAGIVIGQYGNILCEHNIISNNTFTANGGFTGGGGCYVFQTDSGKIFVNSNKILNNQALSTSPFKVGSGGGLYIENCSPYLFNNICAGNSAGIGGGLMISSLDRFKKIMKPVLINNTIIQNQAIIGEQIDSYGGGIYVNKEHNSGPLNPIIINTILWDNKADQGSQIYLDVASIDVAYSDVQGGWDGEGNIDVDPLFAKSSFQLSDSSYCIGAGIASINISDTLLHCPPNDMEGNPRPDPVGSNPDIGANENERSDPIPILTTIDGNHSDLPFQFALMQNYPNPFNPKTIINYQLPARSAGGSITNYVELSIYNLLGQKMATLVSERQKEGTYQVTWDGGNFPSGIYYYRLSAGEFVETKKLMLLR
jgi:predicted GH43/DUF377 family glycosyl hydrolase